MHTQSKAMRYLQAFSIPNCWSFIWATTTATTIFGFSLALPPHSGAQCLRRKLCQELNVMVWCLCAVWLPFFIFVIVAFFAFLLSFHFVCLDVAFFFVSRNGKMSVVVLIGESIVYGWRHWRHDLSPQPLNWHFPIRFHHFRHQLLLLLLLLLRNGKTSSNNTMIIIIMCVMVCLGKYYLWNEIKKKSRNWGKWKKWRSKW